MIWKPKNVFEYELLIIKIWKYSMLSIYKTKRQPNSGNLEFVNKSSYILLIRLCLIILNLVMFVSYFVHDGSLKSYLHQLLYFVIVVHNVGFIFVFYLKRNIIGKLLTRYISAEQLLFKCDLKKFNCGDIGEELVKFACIKSFFVAMMLFGDFKYVVQDTQDYVFRFCFYSQWFLFNLSEFVLIQFSFLLGKLCKEFKSNLQFLVKNNLKETTLIYWTLHNLSHTTNQTLQGFILLKFSTDFFLIGNDIFFGTYFLLTIKTNDFFLYVTVIATTTTWFVIILYADTRVAYIFENILKQVYEFVPLQIIVKHFFLGNTHI
jgi:hypothetical protein